MLDVNLFRSDFENTKRRLLRKKVAASTVDELAAMLAERRRMTTEVEAMRATMNAASKQIGELFAAGKKDEANARRAEVTELKAKIPAVEKQLAELDDKTQYILLRLPNLPMDDAPEGASEADNKVLRTVGYDAAKFPANKFKPHWEVASALGIWDGERAAKIAGSMFALLRGDGARLLRALVQFALDTNRPTYEEVLPPHIVVEETLLASGQLPKFAEEMYRTQDGGYLIPTAEVPLMSLHRDEVFAEADLPRRYMAYTVCFRREAGAAGKDTRGMQRLHEFHKVELVKVCLPSQTPAEFDGLVGDATRVLDRLGLPYRVVDLCAGDMSFGAARTYDLEVYAPGIDKWLEVSSCGIYTDFQTRRGNIKFRSSSTGKLELCHAMNGSGLATPRVWAAIVEHYQQPDGSVRVPEVLQDYMKKKEIRKER